MFNKLESNTELYDLFHLGQFLRCEACGNQVVNNAGPYLRKEMIQAYEVSLRNVEVETFQRKEVIMKHFLVVLITLCLLLSSAYTDLCKADYYPDSVWGSAQLLVSVLDLELKLFERDWNEKIRNRSDPLFEKNYPIMTKTKPEIHINHSSFNDEIRLTAFVDNPSLFLSLTRDDRKVLVKEIVTIISGRMYFEGANIWDGLEYVEGKRKLSEYIIVSVLIGRPNVPPYLLMSNNIIGQAGYENRKYVFSVPYYLDLKNTDGKWVRSDDHPMKGLKRSMLKLILGCWLIGMELHLV